MKARCYKDKKYKAEKLPIVEGIKCEAQDSNSPSLADARHCEVNNQDREGERKYRVGIRLTFREPMYAEKENESKITFM